ncbi:MAG: hypothetical protein M3O02_05340 [Acidobacteriota bacterium]|nr:hypothetical protein [Acidobacteriota bacterium]
MNRRLRVCAVAAGLLLQGGWTRTASAQTGSRAQLSFDPPGSSFDPPGSSSSAPSGESAPAPAESSGTPAKGPRAPAPPKGPQQVDLYGEPVRPFSKLAVGVEGGTLGVGVQLATPLTRTLTLRGGADFLNFGYGLAIDASQYEGQAHLRSGHVSIDWHPLGGGFRISPEALLFESAFSASVYVTGGKSFELGSTSYISSASDPVHGSASISMSHHIMPALTIGWGNMLGQRSRRWSVPFEIGAAYTGHYTVSLELAGTACLTTFTCMSTGSPQVQSSRQQQENDLNETMKRFQIYPILSTGFAYRF